MFINSLIVVFEQHSLGNPVYGLFVNTNSRNKGVSPVIGVILMVALTVILASVIGVFAFNIGDLEEPNVIEQPNSTSQIIYAVDNSPNDTNATHSSTVQVDSSISGGELDDIKIDYQGSADPTDVSSTDDIDTIGIDSDGDGTVEEDFSDDIGGVNTNNGERLRVAVDTNYSLSSGDYVLIKYTGVDNPEEGSYPVTVTLITHSNEEQSLDGTLVIE